MKFRLMALMATLVVAAVAAVSADSPRLRLASVPSASPQGLIEATRSSTQPFSMERAQEWTLRSRAGRTFQILVSLPKKPPPVRGYPVLYVLDPNTAFATLADTVRNQELMFGPVVVVGIGYTSEAEILNRRFDLSPPTVDAAKLPPYYPQGWGPIGGADEFLDFIQEDLKPAIAALVPIDGSHQALFGHSLGGLFVLHALFTHPESFDTYVAGSPSIWFGERAILGELPAFKESQAKSSHHRRLLITIGGLEGTVSPEERRVSEAKKMINPDELIRNANMVNNAEQLAEELKPLSRYGLESSFAEFPDETHNSVIPAYLSRGARFTLSAWFN